MGGQAVANQSTRSPIFKRSGAQVRSSWPDSLLGIGRKQMCRRDAEKGVLVWRGLEFAVQIFGRSLSISGAHNQGSSTSIRVDALANRIAVAVRFAFDCGPLCPTLSRYKPCTAITFAGLAPRWVESLSESRWINMKPTYQVATLQELITFYSGALPDGVLENSIKSPGMQCGNTPSRVRHHQSPLAPQRTS